MKGMKKEAAGGSRAAEVRAGSIPQGPKMPEAMMSMGDKTMMPKMAPTMHTKMHAKMHGGKK